MAKTRISALAAITALALSATDVMPITDTSVPKTNKVTMAQLRTALFAGGAGYSSDPLACGALTATTATFSAAASSVGSSSGPALTAFGDLGAGYSRIWLRNGAGATSAKNWEFAKDLTVANSLQFTPSTAVNGTTFTTPVATLTDTGILTLVGGLTVSSGTATVQALTATTGAFSGGHIIVTGGTNPYLDLDDGSGAGFIQVVAGDINISPRTGKSFTVSSDVNVGAGKFTISASTGNTVVAGTITVASTAVFNGPLTSNAGLFGTTGSFNSALSVATSISVGDPSFVASAGSIRLVNATAIAWRNVGNTADVTASVDSGNTLQINSNLGAQNIITVNRGSAASLLGYFGAFRLGNPLYYLGQDASDNGAILNGAATQANLTWTDTGNFTTRGDLTLGVIGVGTTARQLAIVNSGATAIFATEGSAGGTLISGASAYETIIRGNAGIAFSANAGSMHMQLSSAGALSVAGDLTTSTTTVAGYNFYNSNYRIRVTSATGLMEFLTNNVVGMSLTNGGASVAVAGALSTGSTITGGASVVASLALVAGASSVIAWNGRSQLLSPADGVVTMSNNATTSFSRLVLGGTSASFPAFRVSSAGVEVRLGDDSAYSFLRAGSLLADNFNASNFTGAAKIIGGTTGVTIRNNADNADNFVVDNLGNASARVALTAATDVFSGATSAHRWSGRSMLSSPSDGSITIWNNTQTGFSLLQFGGTTSSFPALKRNGAGLDVRKADDSSSSFITASSFIGGSVDFSTLVGTGKIVGGTTGTTIRNNADSADNLLITDAGAVTIRSTLGVTSDLAVNTNKFTVAAASGNAVIAGTLTVASTVNVTLGALTVSTGAITATANSINAGSFVSAIGGKVQLTGNAFTVSVSTSATNCTVGTNTAGALALVNGSDGTNRFADLVFYSQSTVTVLASQTLAAAPAARTYTCVSGGLKLAMGSGTYNVYAQELQNTTNA